MKAASIAMEVIPMTPEVLEGLSRAEFRWAPKNSVNIEPKCLLSCLGAITGLHEWGLTNELRKSQYSGVMIDIGANFGYFSLLWLSKPQARVIAVEPVPVTFSLLQQNLASYSDRAVAVNKCIGEEKKMVAMSFDPDWPMLAQVATEATADKSEIEMLPLADLLMEHQIKQVDVLKVDAEGYDIKILKSASTLFAAQQIKSVFWESQTYEGKPNSEETAFVQFLITSGYRRIETLDDMAFTCVVS